MPSDIVSETCPAPECNLTPADLEQNLKELQAYATVFRPAFSRVEQAEGAQIYLQGLLSNLPRKSIEPIALAWQVKVRPLQYFIGESPWRPEPVVAVHQRLVVESLGEPDGVALLDESGVVKQGDDSVGVGPQYCGAVGKIANCQVGVYLGYASRKGYSLIAGQLFVPKAWLEEAQAAKRSQCGLPATLTYQTKPELALNLLEQALQRGDFPCRWVAADALYGDSPIFRQGVARLNKWYFAEVACPTPLDPQPARALLAGPAGRKRWSYTPWPTLRTAQVRDLIPRLLPQAWKRYCIKEGSQGPIVCDFSFARVWVSDGEQARTEVWLVTRRNVTDPSEVKFYLSNAPADIAHTELVRVSGLRWPIESIFEEGKGEVGWDHYETRSWCGWHHHMLLVSLAHHFLVRLRVQLRGRAPALTIYQVRLLLTAVLPQPNCDAAAALDLVRYYQKRNYAAYVSHRKVVVARLAV